MFQQILTQDTTGSLSSPGLGALNGELSISGLLKYILLSFSLSNFGNRGVNIKSNEQNFIGPIKKEAF